MNPTTVIPKAGAFMTRSVLAVQPEMDIFSAIQFLLDHKISGAPVVSSQTHMTLVGMLSERDCMSVLANGAFYQQPDGIVADFMRTGVATITPETDLFSVASIFQQNGARRVPVVDKGRIVGVVSRSDVLRASSILWDTATLQSPPDPKYLSEKLKAHMGHDGISQLQKTAV